MSFEVGNNQGKHDDLWNFRGESAKNAGRVKEVGQPARKDTAARRPGQAGTRRTGAAQPKTTSGKLFSVIFISVICIGISVSALIFLGVYSGRPSKTESSVTDFIGNISKARTIAGMLPYPKGVTYDHAEIQSIISPCEMTIYTKGLDGVKKDDLQSCAIFAFGALGNLDVLHFKDVSSDIEYTFTSSSWKGAPSL